MSLDDRLRGAHKRQLEDVKRRVRIDSEVVVPMRSPAPGLRQRALVVAAALVFVVGGSVFVNGLLTDSDGTSLQTGRGGNGDETPADTSTSIQPRTTITTTPEEEPTQSVTTTGPSPSESSRPTEPTSATTAPAASAPRTSLPATTARPSTTAQPVTTVPVPALASGLPNQVCPSGFRAELEAATLRYVGPNQGWGRLDDLVDEQEGPFYFMAWEPGYPEEVTVEIAFAQPVLANEIRVAQDPFTPVSGVIEFGFEDGSSLNVTLSGTDGWKSIAFSPRQLDRFTITRSGPEANVMEVLVCVEAS